MKVKIAAILFLVLVFGWALNNALSYYDPPTKIKWVEYKVLKGQYLSQVASKLSNQFGKHPGTLTDMMYEKNHLSDYYLRQGEIISIPQPR